MKNLIKTSKNILMKKNLLIKAFIFLILLTTNACSMAINSINNSKNENMSINKTINFKDFKNIGQLEKYLNEAYPAGSDANKLIDDMKKGGAGCFSLDKRPFINDETRIKSKNLVRCVSVAQSGLFYEWDWIISVRKDDNGKIKFIIVEREYFGV